MKYKLYNPIKPDTASGLAEFLLPFLQQIGGVVEAVRGSSDISVLLFRLNSSLAKHILPYLSDLKCQPFLEAILNLLNRKSTVANSKPYV